MPPTCERSNSSPTCSGPSEWGGAAHVAVLAIVGVAITVLVRILGHPADVELLVGNIHVHGTTDAATRRRRRIRGALRSLIPISLLSVGAGGTLGPEAPLVTTTGTLATRAGTRLRTRAARRPHAGDHRHGGGFTRAVRRAARRGDLRPRDPAPPRPRVLRGPRPGGDRRTVRLSPCRRRSAASAWNRSGHCRSSITSTASTSRGRCSPVLLGAAIGVLFTCSSAHCTAWPSVVPRWPRPTVGGITLGLLALATPYALTNGEFQIESMIDSPPAVRMLGRSPASPSCSARRSHS